MSSPAVSVVVTSLAPACFRPAFNTRSSATDTDSPDYANEDNIDMLLASMTPEQCVEAGLVDAPAPATSNN